MYYKAKKESGETVRAIRKGECIITGLTDEKKHYSSEDDILSAQAIKGYLRRPRQTENIYIYKTIDSTNQEAKRLASQGAAHGAVIVSEKQTNGRGRMGRNFFSPAMSGIYMSIILGPKLPVEYCVLCTVAASVAVARAIEDVTQIFAQIKWVNDIFVDGKKVCGILAETASAGAGKSFDYMVLGIGLNFVAPKSDFPPELMGLAGALYDKKPDGISRNLMAAEIINHVMDITDTLHTKEFLTEYRSRSMILQKKISITNMGKTMEATAIDIDDNGYLVVKDPSGAIMTLSTGEISVSRIND